MKIKYKLITYRIITNEEALIQLCKRQAKKGWMLDKTGQLFFKFKKTKPQNLNFFVDYHPTSHTYLLSLQRQGYHFIDHLRILNIFYRDDSQLEPIEKDKSIYFQAKLNLFPRWQIIIFLLAGLFFFSIANIFDLYTYLFISTNHMLLYCNELILYLIFKSFGIFLICHALLQLMLRIKCQRQIKKQTIPNWLLNCGYHVSSLFLIISSLLTLLLVIFECINRPILILKNICILAMLFTMTYLVNNHITKIENSTNRALMTILIFFLYTGGFYMVNSYFQPSEQSQKETYGYQSDEHNYQETSFSLFYQQKSNYGTGKLKNEFDEYEETYRETIYTCCNQDIAQRIFAALIINGDHDRRIPEQKTIDEYTEKYGSFSTIKDVPYYQYEKSAANLTAYHFTGGDLCYGYDDHYFILKNNIVFQLKLKNDIDIEKLLAYYNNN